MKKSKFTTKTPSAPTVRSTPPGTIGWSLPGSFKAVATPDFTINEAARRFGTLLISNSNGHILGSISGEDQRGSALTHHLRDTWEASKDGPIRKTEDSLSALGQDMYEVDRSHLLGMLSLVSHWDGAKEFFKLLPMEGIFTIIIDY